MTTIEIKGRIPQVPGPLIEAIQEANLEFAKSFGKKCVENNCLRKEELDVIIGVVCLAKAYETCQEIQRMFDENKVPPPEFINTARNLCYWGTLMLRKNLPKLNK